jgi:hypothetical protein
MDAGYISVTLTYANGQTAILSKTGISSTELTTVSVLGENNTPINDVTKVELTSSLYGVFNHFVITDVKAPPSFTGTYTGDLLDTEVANSFPNLTGTLKATPSSISSNPIASYGITGGTSDLRRWRLKLRHHQGRRLRHAVPQQQYRRLRLRARWPGD